jgi:tetratricopeptide (TPR) repeat protein
MVSREPWNPWDREVRPVRAPDADGTSSGFASLADLISFVGTLAGVIALIGVLLAFDLFLARVDLRASRGHASAEYRQGLALLEAGKSSAAAERFATALAIDRDNGAYALALGDAQRRSGDTQAAEATLKALLDRAENDGAVNLALARVLVAEGRIAESKAYFHRAIFGRWGADSVARRAEARFALIDILASHGGGRELLAELLPIEDVPADSTSLRKRLGGWFLRAGAPARAANMFREVLRRNPRDAEAFAGMGEAALAQGNFRTARADFMEAAALSPGKGAAEARLALTDTLLASDPTAAGLDAREQLARSKALLARMLGVLESCLSRRLLPVAGASRAVLADTTAVRNVQTRADSLTTLAARLWSSYAAGCTAGRSDSVVRLLSIRLSR